jgi:hypothetical protein
MAASAPPLASASSWLATFAYAYLAFVASTRLVTTGSRWAAALVGAGVAYGLVMRVLAALWQYDSAHAAICCAGSMAVAVLCGAWVASAILLPAHRRAGMWACTAVGMLYPVLLAAGSPPDAPVRGLQILDVAGAAVGGFAALWSLAPARHGPVPRICAYGARAAA